MTTTEKMTPAIRRALAYTHIVGELPSGITWRTRMACRDFIDSPAPLTHNVKPEFHAVVEGHALFKAHAAMLRDGWTLSMQWIENRNTISRGVRYAKDVDDGPIRRGAVHCRGAGTRANTFQDLEMVETFTSDRM